MMLIVDFCPGSRTHSEHCLSGALFEQLPEQKQRSNQRFFLNPVDTDIHIHIVRAMESVCRQIIEFHCNLHMDLHGCIRNNSQCWSVVAL